MEKSRSESGSKLPHSKDEAVVAQWAHGPSHAFVPEAAYMVTAGTYRKDRLFNTPQRLSMVTAVLFEQAVSFGWQLQAWAVLSNHYHFVAHAPKDARSLKRMLQAVHSLTARTLNAEDKTAGRKIWFQYWDTCLTFEKSYLARLNYVHNNPLKHGVAATAEQYPWCSMSWFLRETSPGFRRTVLSFKHDRISVDDDF